MISGFGRTCDGRDVKLVSLESEGISCTVLDLGCALRSIEVPDRNGDAVDVLLGYDDADSYLLNSSHFGGVVGRYANRIRGGVCPIDGVVHQLSRNRNGNHMHGGSNGFDKRVWRISEHSGDSVLFELDDPAGTEGYPGNLHATVRYTLSPGMLRAVYTAVSDEDTVCNMINHAYFNLGHSDTIEDHIVTVDAGMYTPLDGESIPTGEIVSVDGTPMDLRSPTRIGDRIRDPFPSIADVGGFDCNWVIGNGRGCATAFSLDTGIRLSISTDMPGLQFYTGNGIKPGTVGKNGSPYGRWSGFCFETQHFPDAPNVPSFPSSVLRKGDAYVHTTEYRFSTE